jgi:hypothetical protein
MTNRNDYPINEPIFPHWGNLGSEKELEMAEWLSEHPTYPTWREKEARGDIINKEYARWRYMEIRIATDTDAKSRMCTECRVPVEGMEARWNHATGRQFVKGQIVIREQVSAQDFNTMHLDCAQQKVMEIKDSITRALDRMEHMINACALIQTRRRGR